MTLYVCLYVVEISENSCTRLLVRILFYGNKMLNVAGETKIKLCGNGGFKTVCDKIRREEVKTEWFWNECELNANMFCRKERIIKFKTNIRKKNEWVEKIRRDEKLYVGWGQ